MTIHLRDAIADLVLRHGGVVRPNHEPMMARVARGLPEGQGDLRPSKDYDAISETLSRELLRGTELTAREARDAAWCLWKTRTAIAEDQATLAPLLARFRALKHKRASRALALSYLTDFGEDRPGLSAVASALRDLVAVMEQPFVSLQDRYRIFDETDGPRRIGDAALTERKSPSRILEEGGLTHKDALSGGLVEPCARQVLERAAEDVRLSPAERLQLIELIAVKEGSRPDGRRDLIFPGHKALVANALLLPYRNRALDDGTKDMILNVLIALDGLGDPRTRSGNWVNAPDARDIAVDWLTRQALRQFLDVVGAVNPNENWKYRRRFWEAMYGNGVIRGAWVVLDQDGVTEARRRFGRNARFGQFLPGGGVQVGHSVLLLRIGKGVCAEWSYSGQCRFWEDAERTGAPKLYNDRYDASDLKYGRRYAPVLEIRHSSHTGPNAWQHKAARQITAMTGERLSARDYML